MDFHRTSPLFQLLYSDNNLPEIHDLFARGEDPNIQAYSGVTPLHVTIGSFTENIGVIWELIYAGADVNLSDHLGFTCLHSAVFFQNYDAIDILTQCGASVNAKTFLGLAPLHIAVTGHEFSLGSYTYRIRPTAWIIGRLLNHEDIDYNVMDYFGQTPLMRAVNQRQDGAALMLLQRNANPNICKKLSNTPLHEAFSRPLGSIENRLMLSGASVYSVDNEGQTPIDILLKNDSRSNDNKKDVLKLIAFKYSVTDDLKRKLARVPELSHFFNNCCDEVDEMHRDFISRNITVHDFVCNCFNEDQFALQIHKPVMVRLVNDIYPTYIANILNIIPRASLLAILEMTAISRTRSKRGEVKDVAYLYSNLSIVTMINKHLSHLDIFRLIVAFSNGKIPDSLNDMRSRFFMPLV